MQQYYDQVEVPFNKALKLDRWKSGRKDEFVFLYQQVQQITHHKNPTQALADAECVENTDYVKVSRKEAPEFFHDLFEFYRTDNEALRNCGGAINPFESKNTAMIQHLIFVYESGFWKLALNSKLEFGVKMRDWLASEVLPSIRKTGGYQIKSSITPQVLIRQTERSVQIQNSKDINTYWYEKGGQKAVISYNFENCKQVTGKTPKQIPGEAYYSAKERLRKTKPELAATMSLNDELIIQKGVRLKDLEEIDRIAPVLFIELEKIGLRIQ